MLKGPRPAPEKRVATRVTKRAPGRIDKPFDKGSRVQVLTGPFEGKLGVVQELDGKGGARVQLGTLSSWVPLVDLVEPMEGRERPYLGSSHRKPGR